MDSGNSGSMHSSSAGDQEFDSTLPQKTTKNSLSSSPLFDPFSHSYNNNQDLVWPSFQNNLQDPGPGQGPEPAMRTEQPLKNSRKRTRASRRAPTTVLTTDTSNFRQMVQEFTGIPAPPFSGTATSSSAYSRRLDLFSGGTLGQFYPFRPSAQKVGTVTPNNVTSNDIFSSSYNQLLSNNSDLGYNDSLQSQLLSRQGFVFGASKSQGSLVGEMGITQEHINANISAFLGEGKGIGRENNGGVVQENNSISTRKEEGGINSWNYSEDFSR